MPDRQRSDGESPRSKEMAAKRNATRTFRNRIALVFDWDETLGPNSYDVLLRSYGIEDTARFHRERVEQRNQDGWDVGLAQACALIEESRARERPLTREHIEEVARGLETFDGVREMFGRVRRRAREIVRDVEVEFYLLTCGFMDLHQSSPIAREFTDMWGSAFAYDDQGRISFIKRTITFHEKTLYLLAMAKGLPVAGPSEPQDVQKHVPEDEWHVPLDQVVYVGDGASDMPAFALMHQHGGLAIGVTKPDGDARQWGGYAHVWETRQVQNLAPAGFREDSELLRSIMLCVESIAARIELRRLARGE